MYTHMYMLYKACSIFGNRESDLHLKPAFSIEYEVCYRNTGDAGRARMHIILTRADKYIDWYSELKASFKINGY